MSTKKYWRGIEEINPSEEYLAKVKNEFEESSDVPFADVESIENAPTTRRDFLKYLGFTTVAATLAASCEMPVRKALPYAIKPEDVTPGVPLHYASTFVDGGIAIPALVKVRDGRPIKIEGNTDSKLFEGASDARMQASVLNLYDAARLQAPLVGGKKSTWKAVDDKVKSGLSGNVYLVSSSVNSPSGNDIINKFVAASGATHVQYDAVSYSGALDANQASFGTRALPMYRFDQADTIVSLGADFLGTWGSSALNTKQYSKGRKVSKKNRKMSKHIQFEGVMSLSGMNSDERIVCRPSELGAIASALLSAMDGGSPNLNNEYINKGIAMTAKALSSGSGLVVCGSNDKNIQAIVNAINSKIGAFGTTISTANANLTKQGSDTDMQSFIDALSGGGVNAVVFHDCNPVYDHPLGDKIKSSLKSAKLSVSLSDRKDETAAVCTVVAPTHHFLESWGDAEPFSGYVSFIQPTINNLFDTRQWQESLMTWAGEEGTWYDYYQNYWTGKLGGQKSFDEALQYGLIEPESISMSGGASASAGEAIAAVAAMPSMAKDDVEVVLYEKVGIGAGGPWSNNPWLLEMPDPISKCTWDNYAIMSQNLAKKFGAQWTDLNEVEREKQVVTIKTKNGSVDMPVLVIPGMHDNVIGLALGYGRGEGVGMAANNGEVVTGVKVAQLAEASSAGIAYTTKASVKSAGKTYPLAVTQTHHSYQERPILHEYTLAEFQKDPDHLANKREHELGHYTAANGVNHHGGDHAEGDHGDAHGAKHDDHKKDDHGHGGHGHDEPEEEKEWQEAFRDNGTLYHMDQHPNHGIKWGMSIDLSTCTGCSACTIACQAENNVSVVGKERVMKVHDMHWIRIDRYFSGDVEDSSSIQTVFQPMLCQHCDNAPCENVCPVNATNHSSEGINQMAYNRCIGTRYCANNCPYKVRRFNWRDFNGADSFVHNLYEDGRRDGVNNNVTRMVLNPDVTVRSRGVMEKCNFCVQKLQTAKRDARKEGRVMKDGEAQTACQTACATGAITFGNVNDKSSEIYKVRHEEQKERVFYTLEEIHTLPNINYLSKIRNTDHVEGRAHLEAHGEEHGGKANHKQEHKTETHG
jgi:molybdopterin-containing oxidoreductase family iron-sulfur binding subunit